MIYLLSDDLMFVSRISASARAAGLEVKSARSVDQIVNLLASQPCRCLLLDLNNPGLVLADLMKSLPEPRPYVVGYGSHVDSATLQAARQAGCDLVLPRSKFVETLERSLPEWAGGRSEH